MNNSCSAASSGTHAVGGSDVDMREEVDLNVSDYVLEAPLTPTPSKRLQRQRLHSDESRESESSKATSLGYSDSGHYSSANVSDSQPMMTSTNSHDVLRQKDQALFLALQDVRRLRSELERLSKSEKWYKQELRQQKHARLEALEKLYGNERNYMQENQRLQRECLRLYAKCGDIERELEQQRAKQTLLARQKEQEAQLRQGPAASQERDFEYEQQQALIADQQQLIEVLRKQKHALLVDFKRLNEEKDAQIYELQRNIAILEAENLQVTRKCKNLIDERSYLEETIIRHGNELLAQKEEQEKLELSAKATQLTIVEQQRELLVKEKEIHELQRNFKQTLQNEIEPDAIHRLSVDYHKDILEKTHEITALKNAQHTLQQELEALSELQAQNEQQQRELEHLEAALADKNCELREMQECDAKKCAEIAALKAEVDEYQNMTRSLEQREQQRQESYIADLLRSQEAIKGVELELINANQRYANICVLCERTRFELELREIELRKLKFEKSRDVEDVQQLREKLTNYLQQTKELSGKINELEEELNGQRAANEELKEEKSTQWTLLEQIKDELLEEESGVSVEDNLAQIKHVNFSVEAFEEAAGQWLKSALRVDEEDVKSVFEKKKIFNDKSGEWLETEFKSQKQGITSVFETDRNLNEKEFNKANKDWFKKDVTTKTESQIKTVFEPNRYLQDAEFIGKIEERLKGHVGRKEQNVKDMHDSQDLRDMDMKIVKMMQFLKNLEEDNVDLKNFIKVKVAADDGKESNHKTSTKINETDSYKNEIKKEHHMEKDLKLSGGESQHHSKTEEGDLKDLNSKLQIMNEYLKEMQKGNNKLKELIKNFNIEIDTEEIFSETELKKIEQQPKLQYTHPNLNSLKQPKVSFSDLTVDRKTEISPYRRDVDFKNLAMKLKETNETNFVEELEAKNDQLKQLLAEQSKSSGDLEANYAVFQVLKKDINQLKAENVEKDAKIQNLQIELEASQANLDTLVKEQQECELKLMEFQRLNTQNAAAHEQVATQLNKSKDDFQTLQSKLLENDAKLYKLQRTKQQLEDCLEQANKQLSQLKLQEQNNQTVEQKLESITKIEDSKLESASIFNPENDIAELLSLRERVKVLEEELKQAYRVDNQQRSERIDLLNQLLEQQNQKVAQLNAAQADWEELVNQLNVAHAQEAATSAELQQKRADLEELNELFQKQNFELQTLYHINQNQDSSKDRELLALQHTCEQQQAAMKTQADLIESLHNKNQHLEKTINEEYAAEVGENKKELRMLRQQVAKFSQERHDFVTRMLGMEGELNDLRKAKRQAIIVPQLIFTDGDTDSLPSLAESSEECNSHQDSVDDHLRILTKVLEHEYKRKNERSELHISTLLSNIKRLKRALATKEQEVGKLQAQQTSSSEQQQELQYTKRQLLEMCQRYKQSQNALKSLEHQLASLRQQYETTDSGKSSSNEPAHEVANLIDDYKKIIQQSAVISKRPKTSAILDLIQRSNQSVPNLNKLESSIADLRHDIQQYIGASQGALSLGNFSTQAYRQPSLLDELHQAAAAQA